MQAGRAVLVAEVRVEAAVALPEVAAVAAEPTLALAALTPAEVQLK